MRQPPRPPPVLLEHDYIGQSQTMGITFPHEPLSPAEDEDDAHLKETELRLGLPGSESHTKKKKDGDGPGLTLRLSSSHGLGAKRGFSDAIDGSGKWVFHGACGNDVESEKFAPLFSPRGGNGGRKGAVAGGSGAMDRGVAGKAVVEEGKCGGTPAAKAQVVGWPPIRNYRRNTMAANPSKNNDSAEDNHCSSCLYVKVSMDGAPYLRKIDLKMYCNYKELSTALERMFSCFITGDCGFHGQTSKDGESNMSEAHGAEYVLTYKDKDGDWMLVGDVPWDMFTDNCKRLRIMKSSEAIGLGRTAPQAADKLKVKE